MSKVKQAVHFLAGVVAGLLNAWSPLAAMQLVLLFAAYELLEQLRIRDRSYEDVLVFSVGWGAGVATAYALLTSAT